MSAEVAVKGTAPRGDDRPVDVDRLRDDRFERFFRAQYPTIVRIAWGVVRDDHLAEDVAQEAMIAARRRFPHLGGSPGDDPAWGSTPGTSRRRFARPNRGNATSRAAQDDTEHAAAWVRTAAAHLALNTVRGQRRHDARQDRVHPDRVVAGPEDVVVDRETGAEVRRALGRLPIRSATVLVLRHIGLSYAEIAEAMEVPASGVGTMLRRAEAAFRKEVENDVDSGVVSGVVSDRKEGRKRGRGKDRDRVREGGR